MDVKEQEYDMVVIGLGPAGMNVAVLAAEMGLRVCGIEKRQVGGECVNAGCLPSKALFQAAKQFNGAENLADHGIKAKILTEAMEPLKRIQTSLDHIRENQLGKLLTNVVILHGEAKFINPYRLVVEMAEGEIQVQAKRIFICTGTVPALPDIDGLDSITYHTNQTIFSLPSIPKRLVVLGGGATGCELAQAFCRLGSDVELINNSQKHLPFADEAAVRIVSQSLAKDGVMIYNNQRIVRVDPAENDTITVLLSSGEKILTDQLLIAVGRRLQLGGLNLQQVGITVKEDRIPVNCYLQTNFPHIFAIGDCNRSAMFSHAAVHQGLVALLGSLVCHPFKPHYHNFVVPWSVFTDPVISQVGWTQDALERRKIHYEEHQIDYSEYSAAQLEKLDKGFIKIFTSRWGRVYGAVVVGEGSQELINQWAMIIQYRIRLHKVFMLQHSFPSISHLNQQLAEKWVREKMRKHPIIGRICRRLW